MTTLKDIKAIFNSIMQVTGACIINLIEVHTGTVETFNSYSELENTAPALEILGVEIKNNIIEIAW